MSTVEVGSGRPVVQRIVELPVRRPTPETFAPFGCLIETVAREPLARRQTQTVWRYPFAAPDSAALVQVIRYRKIEPLCTIIERHLHVTETRVPLHDSPMIILCGAPGDVPRPEAMSAFLIESTGFMLHRGTWHGVDSYPLASFTDLLFLTDAATAAEVLAEGPLTRTELHDFSTESVALSFEVP